MDTRKTALVKSKSSNSTSEAKRNSQKNHKASRSNAEFQPRTIDSTGNQPPMVKKRGVYVEKNPTKISISIRNQSPDVQRSLLSSSPPRPIPRPGKKRFLSSVLTILSKSTAGTQFPDKTEGSRTADKTMIKHKMRREDMQKESTTSQNVSKKKPKYKSRILNNKVNSESFTVLQLKKDISQTSPHNSEYINVEYDARRVDPEIMKWVEYSQSVYLQDDSTVSLATNSKKVRVFEGGSSSYPSTVVVHPKTNDRSLYDFSVDMVKTTMSVYNVETESNQQLLPSTNSSNVTVQKMGYIDRELNMQNVEDIGSQISDVSQKRCSHHAYSIMPDEENECTNKQMLKHFQSQLNNKSPSSKRKRKLKSDSFQYNNVKPLPKTTSLPIPSKRKTIKRDAKKDFLKLLTEELQKKVDSYEEPENFYEALKVIARNKRRSEEWKYEISSEDDDQLCHIKRRKVLSGKSSAKQSSYYTEPRSTHSTGYKNITYKKRKIIKEYPDDDADYGYGYSDHSLEVVGYDYEQATPPSEKPKTASVSFVSHPPTPPTAIEDYDNDFWLDSDCDTNNSMSVQRRYVLDKLANLQTGE